MAEPSIGFKKRAKKSNGGGGAARKRARVGDDDGERKADAGGDTGENEDEDDTLQTIEEVLADQRMRSQLLRAEGALSGSRKNSKQVPAAAEAPETQYGLHDPKKDGAAGQKLLSLLDGQFTGQTGSTQHDQHEELMNQYIEERLNSHKGKKSDTQLDPLEQDDAPASVAVLSEDTLYEDIRKEVAGGQSMASAGDEESADGGVLMWNTGIAEVELPATFHERNIRATQRALVRDQDSATRAMRRPPSSALPANFSTDFNRHRSNYVAELKNLSRDEQRNRGFVKVGNHRSSDDLAVSRFRKMEARRRNR